MLGNGELPGINTQARSIKLRQYFESGDCLAHWDLGNLWVLFAFFQVV